MIPVITTDHLIAQCVDLRATFPGQFRFAWDEAYLAERPDSRRTEAAWLTIIPCRFGRIFPWGGRRLAAYSRSRRRRLACLPGVTVVQGGTVGRLTSGEVIVTFDVDLIDAVADLLKARRPAQVLPAERARRRERMIAVRAACKANRLSQPEMINPTPGV